MKRLLLATAAVLTLAGPALADTYQMDSFTVNAGEQNVHITSPIDLTVQAGDITLHSATQGDLLVWCLDLTDLLFQPYKFNETVYGGGNLPGLPAGGLSAAQIREIASLMKFGLTVNPDADNDAAVQLAIWKTEYGNAFTDTGLSASLSAKVALLLLDAANGGLIDCPTCSLTVLSDAVSAPNQALGFATIPVPAPIVGAGLPGLIAGCFGLWGLQRRRRALKA